MLLRFCEIAMWLKRTLDVGIRWCSELWYRKRIGSVPHWSDAKWTLNERAPVCCVVLYRMCLCCCIISYLSSSPCGQSRCRGATGHCPGSPAQTTTATSFPTSTITPTTLTSPTARPSRNLLQTTPVMPLSFLLKPSSIHFLSSSPLLFSCQSFDHLILHGPWHMTCLDVQLC